MSEEQHKDTYLTIVSPAGQPPVYKEKGSKFFGYAFPVENVEQVQEHLRQLHSEHHAARHICYAYRLGPHGDTFRANDDGEPSGTAGLPIYNQLLSFGVTDTLVAVVRYFGGILLGASGLVSAYKQAARMALEAVKIEERIIRRSVEAHFGYEQLSAVMRLVKDYDLTILEQDMREKCRLRLSARLSAEPAVRTALQNIYGVEVSPEETE